MMGMELNANAPFQYGKPFSDLFVLYNAVLSPPAIIKLPLFFFSGEEMESPRFEKSKSSQSALVWDCGSTLYDSFELNSLKRQLDSAIASRTLSMPHLPGRHVAPPPSRRPSRISISRSLHKFLRSVFRQKQINSISSPNFEARERRADAGFGVLYGDHAPDYSLSAIPEAEFRGFSPEIGSFVRRTASERFTAATSIGISCA